MEYKINKFEITHDYDVQEAIGGSLEYGRFYTDTRIEIVSKDDRCYNLITGKYSIGSVLNIKYLGNNYEMVIRSMTASISRERIITIEIFGSIRHYGDPNIVDTEIVKQHYVELEL